MLAGRCCGYSYLSWSERDAPTSEMGAATHFRPCIDLHAGEVKQIVGGSLTADPAALKTNFVAQHPASYYAELYRKHGLQGTHVIKLGPGNDEAARSALAAWPGGLQVGGGITIENAREWLAAGASKVIVTSWLFEDGRFALQRLQQLEAAVGKERLVVDLSCRRKDSTWIVAMDKWTRLTDLEVNEETIVRLAQHCSEFLIHAADVEGLCRGVDEALVVALGKWAQAAGDIPITYAGGGRTLADLELVHKASQGYVDLTIGRYCTLAKKFIRSWQHFHLPTELLTAVAAQGDCL